MKNTCLSLAALVLAAASLSSCSRANYAFNPSVPAYLGTASHAVAKAPVAAAPAVAAQASVAQPVASAPTATMSTPVATVPVSVAVPATTLPVATQPRAAAAETAAPLAAAPALAAAISTAKPNLVQRIMLKKVLNRLTKAEARQQNTAGTAHATAKSSAYLGLAAIGLALLIIGLIVGSGFLDTIGAIAIVVGLIIFIFNNI